MNYDYVLRYVMLHQELISLTFGAITLALSSFVVLNVKFFIKPLVTLIFLSIVFFYVDIDLSRKNPLIMIDQERLSNVITLLVIISGLLLLDGHNHVKPIVIPSEKPVQASKQVEKLVKGKP